MHTSFLFFSLILKQMGESVVASNPTLQVFVSVGRFENDSLSWERWSFFSPNKYLEEVEFRISCKLLKMGYYWCVPLVLLVLVAV